MPKDKLFHVGYDGMAMPVMGKDKENAREKARTYLESRGYRISLIVATPASKGYREWVEANNLEVLK